MITPRTDPALEAARSRIRTWVPRFAHRLFRVARAHTATDADAQDVVQETWQVLLTRWDRLPEERAALGWLIGVTLNIARSRRRNESRREELLEEKGHWVDPPAGARQAPVEARLLVSAVWRAVGDLPELQREAFVARILNGMSTKEVAHAIGRTEGTVKTSLHRALHKLREEFGDSVEAALESIKAGPSGERKQ